MKILSSALGHELKINRFVFKEGEPAKVDSAPIPPKTESEKLSVNDFDKNVLDDEAALIRAKELVQKVQKTPKFKALTREDFLKLIKKSESSDGNPENDNLKIGFEELSFFEQSLEKILDTEGQSDYGLEVREAGKEWKENLPESVKKLLEKHKTFEAIPGKAFLELSREDRVATFVEKSGDNYKVDFHENQSAFRAIGLGDLLPDDKCLYVKRNGVVGKLTESSIYGTAKIGYEDKLGNYLGINTDDTFELKVAEEEIAEYEKSFSERGISYQRPTPERIKMIQIEFKEKFPEIEEGIGSVALEGSRSYRNLNPGNLKVSKATTLEDARSKYEGVLGIDFDGFLIFESEEYGMNALKKYIKGHGNETVENFMSHYAPKNENDTAAYIGFIEKELNVSKNSKISEVNADKLASIIKRYEGWHAPRGANMELVGDKISVDELIAAAREYKGAPYVLGGQSKGGIDCSGLVIQAFRDKGVINSKADTTAHGLYNMSSKIGKHQGERGDFLFWGKGNKITHIAIILGKNSDGSYRTLESASRLGGVSEANVDPRKGQKYVGKLPKYLS